MADLHITNGDSAAELIRASAIPGDILAWRDPMHHGPFPGGHDLARLSRIRAQYLAGLGLDADTVQRDFAQRDTKLQSAGTYDRVILWFEHDLLDQLQLLQLLDWFSRHDLAGTRLEIICINTFEGVDPFRGLGQLTPEQIGSLFKCQSAVTTAQLELGRDGWAAFRSDDPRDLIGFLERDLSPFPFLRAALERYIEEFPDHESGLSRTERQLLRLIGDGCRAPGQLFVRNMELETALFLGDWRTFSVINDLCTAAEPLARCDRDPFEYPPEMSISRDAFQAQRLSLTRVGQAVLVGRSDAFACLKRDCWLGGVHLQSGISMWTWDAKKRRFLRPAIPEIGGQVENPTD